VHPPALFRADLPYLGHPLGDKRRFNGSHLMISAAFDRSAAYAAAGSWVTSHPRTPRPRTPAPFRGIDHRNACGADAGHGAQAAGALGRAKAAWPQPPGMSPNWKADMQLSDRIAFPSAPRSCSLWVLPGMGPGADSEGGTVSKQTDQRAADRALRKAVRASKLLADAARLMHEAAAGTSTTAEGHYDYLHWANQVEELLSSDHGEAGIGPTLQRIAETVSSPAVKTYEHRRADGTIVRVTIPENE